MESEVTIEDQNLIDHHCEYYTIAQFNTKFCSKSINENNRINHNYNIDKYFSLLHINARSLNKNFDSFEILLKSLQNFPFSIIGVTETWLHTTSPDMFDIQNYTMTRKDRINGRGGGVAMYIHDQLRYKPRPDLCIEGMESLFIEIIYDKEKNIIIGVIYRPLTTN